MIAAFSPAKALFACLLAIAAASCASAPSVRQVHADPSPLERTLAKPIAEFSVSEEPIGKVLDRLAAQLHIKIHLDPNILAPDGTGADQPVTLSVKQVPARRILWILLDQVGLIYWLDDDVVQVSSQRDIAPSQGSHVRVYDVRDLLGWKPGPSAPVPEQTQDRYAHSPPIPFGDYYEADPADLLAFIKIGVAPQSWKDVSTNDDPTITEYRGLLVVSADDACQREIAAIIGQMRAALQGQRPHIVEAPK